MNRNARTIVVVLVAVIAASIASYGVYQAIRRMPVRQVEVASTMVVAAAKDIPVGARLTAGDLKLVPWPARAPVPRGFSKIEDVVDRGVVTEILENEPVTEAKLAPVEGGAGLPPTIPPGMRAISVRVNDVVGVAGFVTPGTRVDVFVTLDQGSNSFTRTVVSNVQVLTAGTRYDLDKSKEGQAMPSSVVTLLLAPDDAARVVLAASEGQIMLALRNPMDVTPTPDAMARTASLFPPSAQEPAPQRAPRPKPAAQPAPPPAPPPPAPPPPYTVEAIRGAKRSEETLR